MSYNYYKNVTRYLNLILILSFDNCKSAEEKLLENDCEPMNIILNEIQEILIVPQVGPIACSLTNGFERFAPGNYEENNESKNAVIEEEDLIKQPNVHMLWF